MSSASPVDRLSTAIADRYRIERELGVGGMATVYLAQDVRHRRAVALKVLHPELSAVLGSDRFLKEIELTASLQHPHILPLFDSGSAGGQLFYVMPFVEGETLRHRLERDRQLPVADAVRIAREVADALTYAHTRGVIHRDIKPENILLQGGHALVADFGIALAVQQAGGTRITQTGLSLGTPQYMSPEQAAGERMVDARSDVYALGVVTYEMLTGEPPFTGPTVQTIVARVLSAEPAPPSEVRKTIPEAVETAVLRALAKLPADRFESAAEFVAAFNQQTAVLPAPDRRRRAPLLAPALGALCIALAATTAWSLWRLARVARTKVTSPVHETSIVLPDTSALAFIGAVPLGIGMQAFAVSREGTMLVFVGKAGATTRLYRRPMGSSTVEVLPGTEGAYAPFFSPDGKAVGYFSGGAVRRTNLDGSATVTLAELQLPYGGVWLDDGRIIVAANEGERLVAVPSSGGAPQPVGPRNVRGVFPEPVPGHDELLFTTDSHLMAVVPIAAEGRVKFLGPRGLVDADSISTATELLYGSHPKYIASGHIIYHTLDGAVMALPYDPSTHRVLGEATAVLSGARLESVWGAGQLVVTKDGTLIYARGENGRRTWLVWRDATGRVDTLKAFGREDYGELDLAPDGARLLVSVCPNQGRCGAQVLNINEGVRVVMPSAAGDATCGLGWQSCNLRDFGWNGSQRIYAAYVPATGDSMSAPFTLSSSPENATADSIARVRVMDVATDGTVLFRRGDSLYVAPDWSSIQHVPANAGFVIPQAEPWGHQVRGGGEWVAYTALNQQAGDYVVFLAHTKPPFENWRASPRGGEEPLWDRKGNLVYREGSRWMRVTPPASPGSRPGVATELFSGQYLNVLGRSHDIGPDGRNLLVAGPVETTTATLTVVTRWLERLQGSVAKP